jgi:hypothetical protein
LYKELNAAYPKGTACFDQLLQTISKAHMARLIALLHCDEEKEDQSLWFLSNEITGMWKALCERIIILSLAETEHDEG